MFGMQSLASSQAMSSGDFRVFQKEDKLYLDLFEINFSWNPATLETVQISNALLQCGSECSWVAPAAAPIASRTSGILKVPKKIISLDMRLKHFTPGEALLLAACVPAGVWVWMLLQ